MKHLTDLVKVEKHNIIDDPILEKTLIKMIAISA
jgi:hypothetical protein